MKLAGLLIATAVVLTSLQAASLHAGDAEIVDLKIRLLEKVPGQDQPQILAQPRIMSVIDRPFWVDVTGTQPSKYDQSKHEVGLRFVAKVNKRSDQRYDLDLDWFRGRPVTSKDQPESEVFLAEKLHARTVLEMNTPKEFRLSANRWMEITLSPPGNDPPPPSEQHLMLTTHIYHQLAGRDKPTLNNSPTMYLIAGQPGRFVSGGEIPSQFDETFHEIGIRMNALAKQTDDQTYLLSLDLTQGNLHIKSSVPNTEVLRNDTTRLRTTLQCGERKKIELSPTSWLELHLEEIGPIEPEPSTTPSPL
ncbi:hypothetical protein AB1K70_09320 [Bremerella sp. JC770]|uniref:hypothetical protein n=1 Tax=Bremerella sp. JC770 TaxID=3232137 RepID=UPI00345A9ADD